MVQILDMRPWGCSQSHVEDATHHTADWDFLVFFFGFSTDWAWKGVVDWDGAWSMEPRQGLPGRGEGTAGSLAHITGRKRHRTPAKGAPENRGSRCNPEVSRQPTNTNTHTQTLLCPFILPLLTARCSSHYRERLGAATQPGAIAHVPCDVPGEGKSPQVHCGLGRERGGGISWNRSGNLLWLFPQRPTLLEDGREPVS